MPVATPLAAGISILYRTISAYQISAKFCLSGEMGKNYGKWESNNYANPRSKERWANLE